jgi:hypothetical protein
MRSNPKQQERDTNAPNMDDLDQERKADAEYTPVAFPSFQVVLNSMKVEGIPIILGRSQHDEGWGPSHHAR